MPAAGTTLMRGDLRPSSQSPTDTGAAHVLLITQRGPLERTAVDGPATFARIFGARVAYSASYDWMQALWSCGAGSVVVSRIVGPAAAVASSNVLNSSSQAVLAVDAANPGEWGSGLERQIEVTGSTFRITVRDGNVTGKPIVSISPWLADVPAAVVWASQDAYVRVRALSGTGLPVPSASTPLSGGADDRGNIVASSWTDAIAKVDDSKGPGQLLAPGVTDATVRAALVNRAAASNFWGLPDFGASGDPSAIQSVITALRTDAPGLGEYGSLVVGQPRLPVGPGGRLVPVPASVVLAGRAAAVDRTDGPGQAPMGEWGKLPAGSQLDRRYTAAERDLIHDAGAIFLHDPYDVPKVYGDRTLADPVARPGREDVANRRVDMSLAARLRYAAEPLVGKRMRSQTDVLPIQAALLTALRFEYDRGSFWEGDGGFEEAVQLDLGADLNPVAQLVQGLVRCRVTYSSPVTGRRLELDLVFRRADVPAPVAA